MAGWNADGSLTYEGRPIALSPREFGAYQELIEVSADALAGVSDQAGYEAALDTLRGRFGRCGMSLPDLPIEYTPALAADLRARCAAASKLFQAVAHQSGLRTAALMQLEGQ